MREWFRKLLGPYRALIRMIRYVGILALVSAVSSCDQSTQSNSPHNPKFDDPKLVAESLKDPERFFRGMTVLAKDLGSPVRYPGGWDIGPGFLITSHLPKGYTFSGTVLIKERARVLIIEKHKSPFSQSDTITVVDAKRINYSSGEFVSGRCQHPRYPRKPGESDAVSIVGVVTGYGPAYFIQPFSSRPDVKTCVHRSKGVRLAWRIDPSSGGIQPIEAEGVVCFSPGINCP